MSDKTLVEHDALLRLLDLPLGAGQLDMDSRAVRAVVWISDDRGACGEHHQDLARLPEDDAPK